MEAHYPFKIYTSGNGNPIIMAEIEGNELYPIYNEFFEERGYSGNGYCWEGHIVQILEQLDPDLLDHIEFDPEAGAFYAIADSEASRKRFVNLISPIFSDLANLATYVAAADRNRIDD